MQLQYEMDHISQRSVSKEALEKWTEFIPKAFQIAESEDNPNINYFLKVTCNSAEEYSGSEDALFIIHVHLLCIF